MNALSVKTLFAVEYGTTLDDIDIELKSIDTHGSQSFIVRINSMKLMFKIELQPKKMAFSSGKLQ